MQIDVARFHDLADAFASSAGVTVDEACAAIQIAYLSAAAESSLEPADREQLRGLCRDVCYVTGYPPLSEAIVGDLELDRYEQLAAIRMLSRELRSAAARDLTYALAYLSLDTTEVAVLDELRHVLELDQVHAAQVAAIARHVLSAETSSRLVSAHE